MIININSPHQTGNPSGQNDTHQKQAHYQYKAHCAVSIERCVSIQ